MRMDLVVRSQVVVVRRMDQVQIVEVVVKMMLNLRRNLSLLRSRRSPRRAVLRSQAVEVRVVVDLVQVVMMMIKSRRRVEVDRIVGVKMILNQ